MVSSVHPKQGGKEKGKERTEHPTGEAQSVLEDPLAAELGHNEGNNCPHDLPEDLAIDGVRFQSLDRKSGTGREGNRKKGRELVQYLVRRIETDREC